ncbi:glycosyltransferase family 61 protein [Lentibacter sp. XHP0401]|uniref:glycosyltransferase family 61 protein n=1 Tax=Lentibacter sp. XHP0401 TaxID=2984334 RepID=UPI0021E894BB|nr:glycosyltransferase family 61 protein [Lentibacter sp. XHP0401]MCV2892647.1 glycosyltransferase family 61 protein [Lentibacter sp. XHP0401]
MDPTEPPNPKGGWSQTALEFERVRIVPPQEIDGRIIRTGVFDEHGADVPVAATWRRDERITLAPDYPVETETNLAGKWLWGGVLYHHFGHFQMQSIARLWAIRRYRDEIEGIIFVTRGQTDMLPFEQDYLALLIGDVPVRVVTEVCDVEALVVPGQGFGLGDIAKGTRVFRRYIAAEFAKDVAPEGPEKLFISRALQPLEKGGFLGEELLDARMEEAGYTVFWPEEHSLREQIARYKAAKRVVGLDGSALHLFAMVGANAQKVAMILRREKGASRALRTHLTSFTGAKPLAINALAKGAEVSVGKKREISELDFEHIGKLLKRHGFIDRAQEWGPLSEAELALVNED